MKTKFHHSMFEDVIHTSRKVGMLKGVTTADDRIEAEYFRYMVFLLPDGKKIIRFAGLIYEFSDLEKVVRGRKDGIKMLGAGVVKVEFFRGLSPFFGRERRPYGKRHFEWDIRGFLCHFISTPGLYGKAKESDVLEALGSEPGAVLTDGLYFPDFECPGPRYGDRYYISVVGLKKDGAHFFLEFEHAGRYTISRY